MSYDHRTEMLYEQHGGAQYPRLVIRVDGCHDVGRMLANLARGNCEHGELAREIARDLNRSEPGRATLAYLVSHGGPDLTPGPCDPCAEGDHEGCWSILSPAPDDECGCHDANPGTHETPAAHARAMGVDA